MTSRRMAWLMAGAVAITSAAPALAQDTTYQQQLRTYQEQRSSYEARRADYDSRQAQYDADRAAYERSRADYDRRYGAGAYDRRYPIEASRWRKPAYPTSNDYYAEQRQFEADRAAYERTRTDYDRRNGRGAYDRRYPDEARRFAISGQSYNQGYDPRDVADYDAQRRQWESDRAAYERARDDYDRRYGRGSYDRRYPNAGDRYDNDPYANRPSTPAYDDRTSLAGGGSYSDPCRDDAKRNATAGGVIGALAGAVIGSNVAARNAKTEGAVLGALVGAGAGAAIGNSSAKARCDSRGQYWSYDDTVPYRESAEYRDRAGGYSDWNRYNERKCRLVQAPTEYQGRTDSRYVRVCPDDEGRYRVDG
ncbi:glycine zipper 2TM domain-containing protein [Caulobacter hibisci]|uniref:17 kDa surface antigen n=1 Tax=Caulobacter hibisci TaxID=2035993 RepID=A0ABS0T025_9CAUL|nr:glycine zipper 2TM domain-containing protein [Caulobacter hibisci]MBI1685056.1 glycine zipper 2TM domain-containing protein [Caulobacter hibisci]